MNVLHNLFDFIKHYCQEQLKTIQQMEKKKKYTSLGVCIMSSIALFDTISK